MNTSDAIRDGAHREDVPFWDKLKKELKGRKVPVELREAQAFIEAVVRSIECDGLKAAVDMSCVHLCMCMFAACNHVHHQQQQPLEPVAVMSCCCAHYCKQ